MIAISTLVLSLALTALAAPSKRQDNGACQALQSTCASSVKSDLSDAWNIKACVFGATCFGGQRPVDGFLAAVYAQKGGKGAAPTSANLARVTSSLFNSISSDHKTLTQQNFIDGFYSSLDASGGPYPTSSSTVESYYQRVAVWTAYCSSAVPLQNFADYFQYSATVSSNGCSGTVTSATIKPVTSASIQTFTFTGPVTTVVTSASTAVTTVTFTDSATTVVTSASTAVANQTALPSQFTSALTSSSFATPTASSVPPSTTTQAISSDATCQKMYTTCIAQSDQKLSNPWSIEACVLGATCFGGHRPVADFLAAVYGAKNPSSTAYPAPDSVPRLSSSLFAKISTDGKTLTQQNFIDAYYSTLSSVSGPYPANTDLVLSYYNRILGWTAFCPGTGIPYMNVADYFEYSATVQGGSAQC